MNIVLINQHPKELLGGSEIQCDIIASKLAEFGHTVTYLAVNGNRPAPRTNYSIHDDVLTSRSVDRLLKQVRADVVYYRYNRHGLLSIASTVRRNGVRFVFAVSSIGDTLKWPVAQKPGISYPSSSFRGLRRLAAAIRHRVNHTGFRFVDGVTSLSADLLGRLPVERQTLIRNSFFDSVSPFSWPRPYVAWVASLKPTKRPEAVLEVAAELGTMGIDVLVAGKIQHEAYRFFELPARLPENVHYLGVRTPPEVNGILDGSLFLVHTCHPEGFGGNFVQAWVRGKPTLTLSFDPDGTIERERLGYRSGSLERLRSDVKHLVENEALRREMGARARAFALQHFDPTHNVRQLERFLREIVEADVRTSKAPASSPTSYQTREPHG